MHKLLHLSLFCSVAGAGACISPVQPTTQNITIDSDTGQRPLEADALRTLLSDAYVTPVQPADVFIDHPPGEIFRSNGDYMRIPNRTREYGTFEIRGNLVCVQGVGIPTLCRHVIPRTNGTYSLTDPSNGSTTLVTIAPH
jgi:hypothetical protein